jgi:hypothetical protein
VEVGGRLQGSSRGDPGAPQRCWGRGATGLTAWVAEAPPTAEFAPPRSAAKLCLRAMNRRRGRRAPPPESRGARPRRRYGAAAASGDPGGEIGEREREREREGRRQRIGGPRG